MVELIDDMVNICLFCVRVYMDVGYIRLGYINALPANRILILVCISYWQTLHHCPCPPCSGRH